MTARAAPMTIRSRLHCTFVVAAIAIAGIVPVAAESAEAAGAAESLDEAAAARFAALALHCVHLEYPNKLAHTLASDADARPPRQLTPAFYDCYD